MIDWDSPSWGQQDTTFHYAENGSWVVTEPDEEPRYGRDVS